MSYFLTKDDLEKALDEEREFLFTAISKALWELEQRISLLINVGLTKSDPTKNKQKGVRKMSEIKDLMENLKTISEAKDDDELQDVVLRLETALEKDAEKWKDFKGQLDDMVGRVKVLEGEKEEEERPSED